MLHVSIHAGPLEKASPFNQVSWLDIGYERLGPISDYKAVLFTVGEGAKPPVLLRRYPRWSASLWDLTVRAIALCLHPDGSDPREEVPPLEPVSKTYAFAHALCAFIEHHPAGRTKRRTTLATAELLQEGRTRGVYRARFEEDAQPVHRTAPFAFRPRILNPAELLMRAALVRLTGEQDRIPPCPSLCVPPPVVSNGIKYVPIHQLVEPARTGFQRWLYHFSEPPVAAKDAPLGIAPETLYAKFLQEAI